MLDDSSTDDMTDYSPLLLKSIEKDVDTAKTHLNNHVTAEERVVVLDKNCEYCQIYFKEECLYDLKLREHKKEYHSY